MTMRKFMFYAMVVMGVMSCQKVDVEEIIDNTDNTQPVEQPAKKFTFTIKGDFNNVSFADGDEAVQANAPRRASSTAMTADGAEMTDLWVIDYKDNDIVQQLHQTPSDEAWGKPQMSLTLGKHHVLFLASRGQNPIYNNGIVTWSKTLDTFYCDYEVEVVKTSNGNRAVTLNRIATKFTLLIEDAIPSGTTSIALSPSVWYNGYDMLSAAPIMATDYSVAFPFTSANWGKAGYSLNIWSLSYPDEWLSDIDIVSQAGTEVNASATIPNAPFKANRVTKYSGNLYTTADELSVALSSEWLPDYEGVF